MREASIGDLECYIKNYKYANIGCKIKDITLYAVNRYLESNKKEFKDFLKQSDSNPCKEYVCIIIIYNQFRNCVNDYSFNLIYMFFLSHLFH